MGFKDLFNKVKGSVHSVPSDELEEDTSIDIGALIGAASALKKAHDSKKAEKEQDQENK